MPRPCCVRAVLHLFGQVLKGAFRVLRLLLAGLLQAGPCSATETAKSLQGTSEFVSFRFKFPSSPNLVDRSA
jgi:hypothetical protein